MSSNSGTRTSAAPEPAGLPAEAFLELLQRELSVCLPGAKAPCAPEGTARALAHRVVDATVRRAAPLALEAQGLAACAQALRELPAVDGFEAARQTMMAVERVAHRHQAPLVLMRAVGGAPSTLLLLARAPVGDPEREAAALFQVAAAVARVVDMAVKAGAPREAVAAALL